MGARALGTRTTEYRIMNQVVIPSSLILLYAFCSVGRRGNHTQQEGREEAEAESLRGRPLLLRWAAGGKSWHGIANVGMGIRGVARLAEDDDSSPAGSKLSDQRVSSLRLAVC